MPTGNRRKFGLALTLLPVLLLAVRCDTSSLSQGIQVTVTWPPDGETYGGRFILIKSDCFDSGQHPCDTWSADWNPSTNDAYFLMVSDLPTENMYLRVERLLSNNCTDIQATSVTAMMPSDYLGASFDVSLDVQNPQPDFKIEQQDLCPFHFLITGLGTGTVSLTDEDSQMTYSNQGQFPSEFPLNTHLVATAIPQADSVFSSWTLPDSCSESTNPTCSFTFTPPGDLSLEFDIE
jgi:hypothetical protein